jgi:CRP-like cAMP-binding protein
MSAGTRTAQLCDLGWLQPLCRTIRFSAGALLREAGHHYRDMYLIADGCVAIQAAPGCAAVDRAAGAPIGEIEFLHGCPATATVTAKTATEAVVIDDATLVRLEAKHLLLSARLLRHLAQLAGEASDSNKRPGDRVAAWSQRRDIEVYLCRSKDMLARAQRLRYEVYCQELQRNSPHADHRRRIIADELDQFGHTFVAVQGGEIIGTLRGNRPSEGALGALEELYGMRTSPRYPTAASVCTKFVVKKAKRGGATALKLISAMVRYGLRQNVTECYADCIPPLLHYYRAIGFEMCGSEFLHPENGRSYPLMLDLAKHGERLSGSASVSTLLGFYLRAKATKLVARLGNSGQLCDG